MVAADEAVAVANEYADPHAPYGDACNNDGACVKKNEATADAAAAVATVILLDGLSLQQLLHWLTVNLLLELMQLGLFLNTSLSKFRMNIILLTIETSIMFYQLLFTKSSHYPHLKKRNYIVDSFLAAIV